MAAQRKIVQQIQSPVRREPAAWEPMTDPLHPMHQDLLRRMSAADDLGALSHPQRFAAIFYLGAAAWVPVVALTAWAVSRIG